jgi:hypothetical protein
MHIRLMRKTGALRCDTTEIVTSCMNNRSTYAFAFFASFTACFAA